MSWGRKIWKVGWRLLICLVLLGWIFHSIFSNEGRWVWERNGRSWASLDTLSRWKVAWTYGPVELMRTLTLVEKKFFVFSLFLMGLTILLGVARWRMVLAAQGLMLSWYRATAISFIAHFFNSFLLGSTGGDLIKAYYAARETQHKKTEAVVAVFVDRLIGLWTMLLFAVLMIGPNWKIFSRDHRLISIAILILAMFVGGSVLLALAFWGRLLQRWPGGWQVLKGIPKGELLEKSLDSCVHFGRSPVLLLRAVAISMLLNAVCVLQFLALAHGLQVSISAAAMFAIVPIVICIAALPITPSGLGVRESLFVILLSAPGIGVAQTPALSISLLAFAGSLFWSLTGGVVYVFLRHREHLDEFTQTGDARL